MKESTPTYALETPEGERMVISGERYSSLDGFCAQTGSEIIGELLVEKSNEDEY